VALIFELRLLNAAALHGTGGLGDSGGCHGRVRSRRATVSGRGCQRRRENASAGRSSKPTEHQPLKYFETRGLAKRAPILRPPIATCVDVNTSKPCG
jgi:hypothetical protein